MGIVVVLVGDVFNLVLLLEVLVVMVVIDVVVWFVEMGMWVVLVLMDEECVGYWMVF